MLKRSMSPRVASYKKRTGHINERNFAELIDGEVVGGRTTNKTDVIDRQGNTYTVKGGEWWQIFLYGRERFVNNTEFQEIGNVANLMIDCLDAFPENRADYLIDKDTYKRQLQIPMRQLKDEIRKPDIFPSLLEKGIFNGSEVGYLAILPKGLSGRHIPLEQKHFHLFAAADVIHILSTKLVIQNSKAHHSGQTNDQKVIFRYRTGVGEIEIRTDSDVHYRQVKWRFNAPSILRILRSSLERILVEDRQVSVYGSAREYL